MLTKSVMLAYICEYTHIYKSASKSLSSFFFFGKKKRKALIVLLSVLIFRGKHCVTCQSPLIFFVSSSFFFFYRCAFVCDFLGLSRTALFDVLDLYADSKLLLASLTSYFSLSFFFFFFELLYGGLIKMCREYFSTCPTTKERKKKKKKTREKTLRVMICFSQRITHICY